MPNLPNSGREEAEKIIKAAKEKREQSIKLHHLKLTALPESLLELRHITGLEVYANDLSALPDWIGEFSQLERLDVSQNLLSHLPDSLGKLTKLQRLLLSDNQLMELPECLAKLKELRRLELRNNQLKTLPEWIGQLQLEWLDVSDNTLADLPNSLRNMSSLKRLFLIGNEKLSIPPEVLEPLARPADKTTSPDKILDFFFYTRGNDRRQLREVNLFVLGDVGVGKTSLIKRLNDKPLDLNEEDTPGIVISHLNLAYEHGHVRVRVWDFGGDLIYHAMHEFFLNPHSIYLLVIHERPELVERDVAYWMQIIRTRAPGAPVIIALNKSGGRTFEMAFATLNEEFKPISCWVSTECDANYSESIAVLRDALKCEIEKMAAVKSVFPRKWMDIKQRLEEMARSGKTHFLTFDDFKRECGQYGETSEEQQIQLAERLHNMNIALNFRDDELLKETSVLLPDWLANGICAILRANDELAHAKKNVPEGKLTRSILKSVFAASEEKGWLNADDYPERMWPFLMRVMIRFKLGHPIDSARDELLVPLLLPIEVPSEAMELEGPGRLQLRYEFTIVPPPLVPKLLVLIYPLIEIPLLWRRGAMLRQHGARARVWVEPYQRYVNVTVVGPLDQRKALLEVIQNAMEEMMASPGTLDFVEQWEHKGDWVPRRTLVSFGIKPELVYREREDASRDREDAL